MESPAWSGPPQPPANPPARNGANPPVLPRRIGLGSLAPGLRDSPPTYSSLPGRFPSPRSPEDTRMTVSATQDGGEQGRSVPGQADGQAQEAGPAEAGGAGSGGAPGEADARGA